MDETTKVYRLADLGDNARRLQCPGTYGVTQERALENGRGIGYDIKRCIVVQIEDLFALFKLPKHWR